MINRIRHVDTLMLPPLPREDGIMCSAFVLYNCYVGEAKRTVKDSGLGEKRPSL